MPSTKTKPGTGTPQENFDREIPGMEDSFNGASAQYPSGHPSATQGFQDARKMAGGINKIASNPSSEGMTSAGRALLRGIKGNNKNNKEETRRQKMQNQLIQRGKKMLDKKAKQVAITNAGETVGLSIVAYYAVKHWKVTIAIIASIFLILFAIFDQQIFDNQDQQSTTPTTNDTCSPAQFTGDAFGKTSVCTITVIYNGSADDINITDTILPGTAFVSAGQKGTFNQPANTVTWDAAQLKLPLNPINITITVTVRVTTHQNNTIVYNAYSVNPTNLQNGTSGSIGSSNVPPNQSTCNGKYNLLNPYNNFGDPQCNFTVQQFGQEVKQMDPSHYLIWDCMASHESGYNPNAYNPGSTSGKGAYGLLQMNPKGQGNGQYDAGNVNWSLQISNAINYNQKVIGGSFAYWATYAGCH